MSCSFRTLDSLEPPFSLVDERVISVPGGASLITNNTDFKMIAYFEGGFDMVIDGKDRFSIQSGDIMVLPRACQQMYSPQRETAETRLHACRILFDRTCLQPKAQRKSRRHPLVEWTAREFTNIRHFPGGLKGEAGHLLNALLKEIDEEPFAYRINAEALLRQLVVAILRGTREPRLVGRKGGSESNRVDAVIKQARGWLGENFEHPFKLADIAWHLRLSEEHLARLFRDHTGETVMDYTRRLRIDKARRLLLGSNETLSAIAKACGFRSLAVFSVNFKRVTGEGPGTYRRLNAPRIRYPKSNLKWW